MGATARRHELDVSCCMHSYAHIRATTIQARSVPTTHVRGAFTLIEVLFALILVSVALLALEATTTRTLQRIADTHREALATALARQQLDRLIASQCASSAGVDSVSDVVVHWGTRVSATIPPTAMVVQHAQYSLAFGAHHDSLTALIPCH